MKRNIFTEILAIAGTTLAWFPILAPILLSIGFLVTNHLFRLDYLMPAELFPIVFLGGAVLLWAAVRAHSRAKLISWGLGLAVVMLFGGQGLSMATGLASGATEPTGWQFALVVASLVIYSLAVVAMGVGGILLLGDLFRRTREGR
jgi:hypothetical protein